MPEVKIGGKNKKFPYTAKGKKAAKKAKMMADPDDSMGEEMEKKFKANRMMKRKSHYRTS